jgi:hypothetical protein
MLCCAIAPIISVPGRRVYGRRPPFTRLSTYGNGASIASTGTACPEIVPTELPWQGRFFPFTPL